MGFLRPNEFFRIKLLSLQIQRVYMSSQRPLLFCLVIIGVIGFERSLYIQIRVKLFQVDTFGELLLGRFRPIVDQPLRGLNTIPRDT